MEKRKSIKDLLIECRAQVDKACEQLQLDSEKTKK
jgi:hypothetical protein